MKKKKPLLQVVIKNNFTYLSILFDGKWRNTRTASKKNMADKISARPTNPATASVCTGCTANIPLATQAADWLGRSHVASRWTRQVHKTCRITFTRWQENGWNPAHRQLRRYVSTQRGRQEPWELGDLREVPQKSLWNRVSSGLDGSMSGLDRMTRL